MKCYTALMQRRSFYCAAIASILTIIPMQTFAGSPATRPATQPSLNFKDAVLKLRNSQLKWQIARDATLPLGVLQEHGSFKLVNNAPDDLEGPANDVLSLASEHMHDPDANFMRSNIVPVLLEAMDDPERFAVAHHILLHLFPKFTKRTVEATGEKVVVVEDGLRVTLTPRRPETMWLGSEAEDPQMLSFFLSTAEYDAKVRATLRDRWEGRCVGWELFTP
jgi:hypothetical protein